MDLPSTSDECSLLTWHLQSGVIGQMFLIKAFADIEILIEKASNNL